jgi:hypothetical protein
MPQVQILPKFQSPLEQLMPHIESAMGDVAGGYGQHLTNKKDKSILEQLQGAQTPMEQWSLIAQLSPEKGKTVAAMSTPYNTQMAKSGAKAAEKQALNQTAEKHIQSAVDTIGTMLKNEAPGIGYSPDAALGLDRQAIQNREYFNGLRSTFEMALLPRVNKGTLAKPRFDYIMGLIAKGDESHRAIAGKTQALADALSQEGIKINTDILSSIPGFQNPKESKGVEASISGKKESRPPLESFVK